MYIYNRSRAANEYFDMIVFLSAGKSIGNKERSIAVVVINLFKPKGGANS
jgi:hypothetical protein